MNKIFLKILSLVTLTCPALAHDGNWTAARPDGHAPISVMGDHMHKMGEWMISYRYMTMDMEGLLDGSSKVTAMGASSKYGFNAMMLPIKMTMDMHMFGTMHAISDQWTLMGMLNYLDNEMSMQGASMAPMETSGLGDVKVSGLYDLARLEGGRRVHLNLGISLPSGAIDEKRVDGTIMPYGMQLGSGTWDLLPALTFLGQSDDYSWGAQIGGTLRLDDNDRGYSLGNRFEASLWGARKVSDYLSVSAKLDHTSQDDLDGQDKDVTMMMRNISPGYVPSHQGNDRTTLGLGFNYYFIDGGLKGHRFAAEWETPLDQKANGVQLELDSIWTLGWQYAW